VANFLLNYALITGMFGLPKLGLMGIGWSRRLSPTSWRWRWRGIRRHPAYEAYPLRQGCRG
jgi:MATE family multidrug resistance protein